MVHAVVAAIGRYRVDVQVSQATDHLEAIYLDHHNLGLAVIERLNNLQLDSSSKLDYLHMTQPRYIAYRETDSSRQGSE